ncbi:MAG: hypothetical protein ACPH4G_08415, partial [Henriciella sp.]
TISGTISYDRVPHNNSTNGLDYLATVQLPARGVTVEAVDASGTVLASDTTDESGEYNVDVDSGIGLRIQVRSQLEKTDAASWDIKILDNTSDYALYVLNGALLDSGTANSVRDLNAGSGWTGQSYSETRAAAPFAILDSVYEAVIQLEAIDPDIQLPSLEILWSVDNRPSSGNVTDGNIGTSSYSRTTRGPTIRILGAANNDTDEYDDHVVVHEFAHYLEDQISRSDSIGGPHGGADRLDTRVAFSEGLGNAFAGMILTDPIYQDSFGARQEAGFNVNVETNFFTKGWFSESSVQSVLYDIFDSEDDGVDNISAGLSPIYTILTDPDYITSPDFTTIFLFADLARTKSGIDPNDLTALFTAELITGTGPQGDGETLSGNFPRALPVYKPVPIDGDPVEICSIDDNGTYNKHGNRAFLTFSIAESGNYTFTMSRDLSSDLNTPNRDPDILVFKDAVLINRFESDATDVETGTMTLEPGDYHIEAYEFNNVAERDTGDSCFNFTISS